MRPTLQTQELAPDQTSLVRPLQGICHSRDVHGGTEASSDGKLLTPLGTAPLQGQSSERTAAITADPPAPLFPIAHPRLTHYTEKIALVCFLRQWSDKSIYNRMFEHVFIKFSVDSV